MELSTITDFISHDYNPITSPVKNGSILLLKVTRLFQAALYSMVNAIFSTNYQVDKWDVIDDKSPIRLFFLCLPLIGTFGVYLFDMCSGAEEIENKKSGISSDSEEINASKVKTEQNKKGLEIKSPVEDFFFTVGRSVEEDLSLFNGIEESLILSRSEAGEYQKIDRFMVRKNRLDTALRTYKGKIGNRASQSNYKKVLLEKIEKLMKFSRKEIGSFSQNGFDFYEFYVEKTFEETATKKSGSLPAVKGMFDRFTTEQKIDFIIRFPWILERKPFSIKDLLQSFEKASDQDKSLWLDLKEVRSRVQEKLTPEEKMLYATHNPRLLLHFPEIINKENNLILDPKYSSLVIQNLETFIYRILPEQIASLFQQGDKSQREAMLNHPHALKNLNLTSEEVIGAIISLVNEQNSFAFLMVLETVLPKELLEALFEEGELSEDLKQELIQTPIKYPPASSFQNNSPFIQFFQKMKGNQGYDVSRVPEEILEEAFVAATTQEQLNLVQILSIRNCDFMRSIREDSQTYPEVVEALEKLDNLQQSEESDEDEW